MCELRPPTVYGADNVVKIDVWSLAESPREILHHGVERIGVPRRQREQSRTFDCLPRWLLTRLLQHNMRVGPAKSE